MGKHFDRGTVHLIYAGLSEKFQTSSKISFVALIVAYQSHQRTKMNAMSDSRLFAALKHKALEKKIYTKTVIAYLSQSKHVALQRPYTK